MKKLYPSIILAAEDSTAYPMVTSPVEKGGLGFNYKWDMGWMNDTLSFMQQNPEKRRNEYHKLTFSMMYFYDEKFVMPFSHDEVVHGKATIVQKMNGEYEEKFPQARTLYMYAHPGKKLNFMGNEFAQLREWDEKREQDNYTTAQFKPQKDTCNESKTENVLNRQFQNREYRDVVKSVPIKGQAAWTAWNWKNLTDISVRTGTVSGSKSEKGVTGHSQ